MDIRNRRAVVTSRRATLLTLGIAGWVAALAHPLTANGKKNGSNKTKKLKQARKQCQRDLTECTTDVERCAAQPEQCVAIVDEFCGDVPFCQAQKACCAFLANCDAVAFLACIF